MKTAVGTSTSAVMDPVKSTTSTVTDGAKTGLKTSTDFVNDTFKQVPGVSQVQDVTQQSFGQVESTLRQVPGLDKVIDSSKGVQKTIVKGTKATIELSTDTTKKLSSEVMSGCDGGMKYGVGLMNTGGEMTMGGINTFGELASDGVNTFPGGSVILDSSKAVTGPVMDTTKKAGGFMVEGVNATSSGFIDAGNASTGMMDDTLSFSLGNVTDTFDTLGAAAGMQSLMGGMFGGNIDKSDEGLAAMFKELDADGSGKVSESEMKAAIMKVYGEGLDEEILKEMMAAADTDKDGEIDLDEFKVIMRAGPDSTSDA